MGEIQFLFLNAGIAIGKAGHETSFDASGAADFRRTIEVDLYGVFHGLATFVPVMTTPNRKRPGAICATASGAGLMNSAALQHVSYNVAKHGVVLLMESLHASLSKQFPPPAGGGPSLMSAHVLCPAMVTTNIIDTAVSLGDPEENLKALG